MAENSIETVRLLVVNQDPASIAPLLPIAESNCWSLDTVRNCWDAMEILQSDASPHAVLYELPHRAANDLFLLRWLRRLRPDLAIVVVCQREDANKKDEAMRFGASTFLVKPVDEQEIEGAIRRCLKDPPVDLDREIPPNALQPIAEDEFFLSIGPLMQKVQAQAELLAQSDVPVLIVGETGTEKVTVARLIHKLSVHSGFRFHQVNCGAIPPQMLESELFGKKSNSNVSWNLGKLHDEEHGTLLLEEIFHMPLSLQSRLADFLHNQSRDAGSSVQHGPRILVTADVNLDKAREENRLRDDLYHRLAPFTLYVPALRRRKDEILLLLGYTMNKLARRYDLLPREFSEQTITKCVNHTWPGNFWEMEDFVKRYLITGRDELNPTAHDFVCRPIPNSGPSRKVPMPAVHMECEKLGSDSAMSLKVLLENVKSQTERNAIAVALQKTGWNRKAAARFLGVSYRSLLYKIERYHMRSSDPEFAMSTLKTAAVSEPPEMIRNRNAV